MIADSIHVVMTMRDLAGEDCEVGEQLHLRLVGKDRLDRDCVEWESKNKYFNFLNNGQGRRSKLRHGFHFFFFSNLQKGFNLWGRG